jgi:hypothetical protein
VKNDENAAASKCKQTVSVCACLKTCKAERNSEKRCQMDVCSGDPLVKGRNPEVLQSDILGIKLTMQA